ncbi:unnamed protein product [Choristocarpus tenellus]
MVTMALLSSASSFDKVNFAHSLFDFVGEGDLNIDETTILLRTALVGCGKIDSRVAVPSTQDLEELCRQAFDEVCRSMFSK